MRASVAAFDRDTANAPQWDEFRALLLAACAWWGISDLRPTREQWAAYTAAAGLADVHEYAIDIDRRSFRHAWAAHEYRGSRHRLEAPFPLEPADYDRGRRAPLKGQIQDALVAFLLALVSDGDGSEFWDPRTNRLVRDGVRVEAALGPDAARQGAEPGAAAKDASPAVRDFYARVGQLEKRIIPALLAEAERIAAELEMPAPASWSEFGRRLALLVSIRGVLERLSPAVFEASLSDLMTLISPLDDTGRSTAHARYTRRLAARYVRPGVALTRVQLSNAVTLAMQIQREWRARTGQAPPTVLPLRLDESQLAWTFAGAQLEAIGRVLGLQGDDRLELRTIPDLQTRLAQIRTSESLRL